MVPMVFVNEGFHHCLIALLSVTLPVSFHYHEKSIEFVILDCINFLLVVLRLIRFPNDCRLLTSLIILCYSYYFGFFYPLIRDCQLV